MPIIRPLACLVVLWSLAATAPGRADDTLARRFNAAVLTLENRFIVYDSGYRSIPYPGGDVPDGLGVCSDVVVRAYRGIGIDLQALVHDDMRRNFGAYPKLWGLSRPDANIDHRRVPNLATFFGRKGARLAVTEIPDDYRPGDIVTWNLRQTGALPHIGIVTERRTPDGLRPLIMHNIGRGQVLEDMLFDYAITGHYRYGID